MLFCLRGGIDQIVQFHLFRVHALFAHFPAAHTLTACPALLQFALYILPQRRATVAFHHIRGRDVPDDTVDPAIARDGWA